MSRCRLYTRVIYVGSSKAGLVMSLILREPMLPTGCSTVVTLLYKLELEVGLLVLDSLFLATIGLDGNGLPESRSGSRTLFRLRQGVFELFRVGGSCEAGVPLALCWSYGSASLTSLSLWSTPGILLDGGIVSARPGWWRPQARLCGSCNGSHSSRMDEVVTLSESRV